jgi:hypothetical protein
LSKKNQREGLGDEETDMKRTPFLNVLNILLGVLDICTSGLLVGVEVVLGRGLARL